MGRSHFLLMLLLSGLFALRVVAQLVQAIHEVSFLPPFAVWQGSSLPYPALLGSQAGILAVIVVVLWRVKTNAISPRAWHYRACFVLGGVYLAVMAFRFITGLTLLSDNAWFASSVPALFHIVLASLILVLGHYLLTLDNLRANEPD